MEETQDREIAHGLREGKTEAWGALYETYFDRVWESVARMMGPDPAEVADVVQDTFLAAARSARSYDPARGSIRLWLGGIARHHVATHYRQKQRDDRLGPRGDLSAAVGRQLAERLSGRDDPPSEALASGELAELVRATLSELRADYEVLLTAKYCDGVTVDEMARLENCSPTAMRSRLARARRAFRQAFEKASSGFDDGQKGARHES